MNISTIQRSGRFQMLAGGLMLLACGMSTGCQIDVAGQTLPSPWHLSDDVQYYAPGPEFKLANEANAVLSDPDKRALYARLGKDWEAYARAGATAGAGTGAVPARARRVPDRRPTAPRARTRGP